MQRSNSKRRKRSAAAEKIRARLSNLKRMKKKD
jgi:hypothetical protein